MTQHSDYYCATCKLEWDDAAELYCPHCGAGIRTSDYGIKAPRPAKIEAEEE